LSALGDGGGDSDDRAWTSWDGEGYVPPEQRIAVGPGTNGALWRLAELTQQLLDGTATDAVVSEVQRLVGDVLRPDEPAGPTLRDTRQPS
jgi:hypothetical protein